jgi:hypothetical protein
MFGVAAFTASCLLNLFEPHSPQSRLTFKYH